MSKVRKLKELLEANRATYGPIRGTTVTCLALQEQLRAARKKMSEEQRKGEPDNRENMGLYGFSIREIAEALCGSEWVNRLNPAYAGGRSLSAGGMDLSEAGAIELFEDVGGVGVGSFLNITNTLLSSKIHEGYSNPLFIGDSLVTRVPTRLSGERIATAGSIDEDADIVPEMDTYPTVGFGEHFIQTPSTLKRGLIVGVSREAIFFDQTGQVAQRAFSAGEVLGRNREKRIIDVVIGVSNPYSENGTALNTYLTSGLYTNSIGTNELIDWTDVEGAQVNLWSHTDPANTEPIVVVPDTIIVHSTKLWTARRIISAVEIRTNTASAVQTTIAGNPIPSGLRAVASPFADARFTAGTVLTTTWFFGAPRRAFLYMENWPLTVTQAPANEPAEFEQDIVLRVRASERGVAAVQEPRAMVRSIAA